MAKRGVVVSHLSEVGVFRALDVPKYVERTEGLARQFGASLG